MSDTKFTQGPWEFKPMEGFDALHKLQGATPEPHEGYFRTNSGDWGVSHKEGRVCLVDFKGNVKRGQGYLAPDQEGMANAHLIAAAPDMYEALKRVVENKWEPDKYHMAVTEALRKAEGK